MTVVAPSLAFSVSLSLCMSCLPDDENRVMDVAVENEAEVCVGCSIRDGQL